MIAVAAGMSATHGAQAETRSLKLYYIHTKEKAEIVFKRNGKYDQAGLKKLNYFLRDFRHNEPTKMDPRLFDLVWEIYRRVGAKGYIYVVSGYRSPATNEMLRRTRGGQAKKSQHMLGKAMDFFIPGIKLEKIRETAMKLQSGGVGYYPKSGSPFVHVDVAGVRAWPRMSRQQLTKLFPNGKTLHLPPDGKPLPGYDVALAQYKARNGAVASSTSSVASSSNGKKRTGLLAALFGGGGDEDEEPNVIAEVPKPVPAPPLLSAPAQTEVAALPGVAPAPAEVALALPVNAPVPLARPRTEPAVAAEPSVVMAALAPPAPVVPAQAEIDAFAAAANVDVATTQPASVDLSSIRAPVPQLLAERARVDEGGDVGADRAITDNVASKSAAVEVASLPVGKAVQVDRPATKLAVTAAPTDSFGGYLYADGFIPLPIRRPGDRASERIARVIPSLAPVREMVSPLPLPVRARRNRADGVAQLRNVETTKGARPSVSGRIKGSEVVLNADLIAKWALQKANAKTSRPKAGRLGKLVGASMIDRSQTGATSFVHDGGASSRAGFTSQVPNFRKVTQAGN